MIRSYVNALRGEFQNYNRQRFAKDLMAGITVTAVALPLALAFGVASGATPQAGLITAVIAGLIIGSFSGASFQISGPTGAMSAILISLVARHGLQGVFLATFIAGLMLIALSFMRGGKLVSVIPMPVISGFTSGIALTIMLGQIDNFLGVHSEGASPIMRVLSYREFGFTPEIFTLIIGLLTIAIMVTWPKRWRSAIPGSLVAIAITTVIAGLFKWDIATVGEIPRSLLADEHLSFSGVTFDSITGIFSPAISIAMLGMIESLLCGASGARMTGKPFNPDQELLAQGIGNVIIPFFGGVPATAAIARTSVAIKSGLETRLAGIIHALGLLLTILLLGSVMSRIPMATLAGVLMVTAWRMNEWALIRYIAKHHFKTAAAKFLITMSVTVIFDLTTAILAGVFFSILMLIVKLSNIEINAAEVDLNKISGYEDYELNLLKKTVVVYISGPIFFASIDKIKAKLADYYEPEVVIFSMRGVPLIDTSGLKSIEEYCDELHSENKKIVFSSLQTKVSTMFERAGLVKKYGAENFYWSVERALANKELFARPSSCLLPAITRAEGPVIDTETSGETTSETTIETTSDTKNDSADEA